jgi:D-3-phosphoglycerate dehydrogenase / 2-oxoglutarate reductase
VLALINATVTEDVAAALASERSWELVRAGLISDEVAAMPALRRQLVRALIVETEPVGDELLAQLPGLEVIACLRSDPVNVDVAAASARGVVVIHAPGRNAEAVADFTLGLCLAALRGIAIAHHGIVSGRLTGGSAHTAAGDTIWRPADPAAPIPYHVYQGRELSALLVGVIGFGWAGQAVARRFAGLVHEVHVADPAVPADVIKDRGFIPTPLPELLARCDIVTIHARSEATVIGPDELRAMKRGAILLNTARATVLDYDALRDALDSGHLKAAGLDVFPVEPIPASSELLRQAGLTLTPHLAGATEDVTGRQSQILLAAMRGLYAGDDWDELPVRNPELYPRWTGGMR